MEVTLFLGAVPAVAGGTGEQGLKLARQAGDVGSLLGDLLVELLAVLPEERRSNQCRRDVLPVMSHGECPVAALGLGRHLTAPGRVGSQESSASSSRSRNRGNLLWSVSLSSGSTEPPPPPMSFGNCGYGRADGHLREKAAPERPAVAYAGDGARGMSMGEIMTCVRHDLPVTAVVLHNRQWGAEKKNEGRHLQPPLRRG